MEPSLTMEQVYLTIRDAKESRNRYFDAVAQACGISPDSEGFEQMVKSMVVSGFLRDREGQLSIGPTPMQSLDGVVVPARRPRPDVVTAHTDRLKVGRRMRLWDDEIPTGSDYVRDSEGMLVCAVGIVKTGEPTVRVGVGIHYEDKRNWSGANGGSTVVFRSSEIGQLDRAVERVIAAAEAARGPYREADRRVYRALDDYMFWEGKRIGENNADLVRGLMGQIDQNAQFEGSDARLGGAQKFADDLDPRDREQYDRWLQLYQQHLNPRGRDQITAYQSQRNEATANMLALTTRLTLDQAREWVALDALTTVMHNNQSREQRLREDELWDIAGCSQHRGFNWMQCFARYHLSNRENDSRQLQIDEIYAAAEAVDAETMAKIDEARAEMVAADKAYDEIAGHSIIRVDIPAEWGTLVVDAVQGEEGEGHRFHMGVSQPDFGQDWSPSDGNAFMPTAGEMRKVAKMVRDLYAGAIPAGYQPPPVAVVDGV